MHFASKTRVDEPSCQDRDLDLNGVERFLTEVYEKQTGNIHPNHITIGVLREVSIKKNTTHSRITLE